MENNYKLSMLSAEFENLHPSKFIIHNPLFGEAVVIRQNLKGLGYGE